MMIKKIGMILFILFIFCNCSHAQGKNWFNLAILIDDQLPGNGSITDGNFVVTFKGSAHRQIPFVYDKYGVLQLRNTSDYDLLKSENDTSEIVSLKLHFKYKKQIPPLERDSEYAKVFLVGLNLNNFQNGIDEREYTFNIDKDFFSRSWADRFPNFHFYFWRIYNNSYERVQVYKRMYKEAYNIYCKATPAYKANDPMGSFLWLSNYYVHKNFLLDLVPIPTHFFTACCPHGTRMR